VQGILEIDVSDTVFWDYYCMALLIGDGFQVCTGKISSFFVLNFHWIEKTWSI
jgi:hypothetical protein